MKLRGVEFGHVLDASGARNFDGRGWWYHRWARALGLDFTGSTFVAKTTTAHPNKGNMPLKADGMTPQELFPRCIHVNRKHQCALNAVGLSGPGAEFLFKNAGWDRMTRPFFLSFMALPEQTGGSTPEFQAYTFAAHLMQYLPRFHAPVGLQLNISCPNVGAVPMEPEAAIRNAHAQLDALARANIPLMLKVSVTTPVDVALRMADHPACDALCVSNTVPFGALPDQIRWNDLFGTADKKKSPLAQYGGGGLSGAPLLPLVENWVWEARMMGYEKPINAGGGILCAADADRLIAVGADSVFLGSIAFLRPWEVSRTIHHVNTTSRLAGR